MIKIISSHTNIGGSTIMLINLTNELNHRGYKTTMYGNHTWFMDKCNSDKYDNLIINEDDYLIAHHINLNYKPKCKKVLMVCHEKEWSIINKINKFWDKAIFTTEENRIFHNYNDEYSIIPNIKSNLKKVNKEKVKNIAGVIGTIEKRKQTHVSIKRALDDGCKKVLLFGSVGNTDYFVDNVFPLLSDKVVMKGFEPNIQKIYDQIEKVYMLSGSEVATLVKDDCYLTGTEFIGNENTSHIVSALTNDEIIDLWLKELEI